LLGAQVTHRHGMVPATEPNGRVILASAGAINGHHAPARGIPQPSITVRV
jgi:hypothetical protein